MSTDETATPLFTITAEDAAEQSEAAQRRARAEASRCIQRVRESYESDAVKASDAGLADVAALLWAIVRELDRAAKLALDGGHEYDRALGEGCTRCAALPGEGVMCEPGEPDLVHVEGAS